jgi:hypothetical protein
MNASGCGATVKDYGHLLSNDPVYSEKAERIAALTKDLAEILPACTDKLRPLIASNDRRRVVFHPPCTLQHGQQIKGVVEGLLRSLDIDVRVPSDAHLRCGSAGTYSISQPALASQLRDNKVVALEALEATEPDLIVSANIGCISHLASASKAPVRHWIELLDDMLSQAHMIERWTGGSRWQQVAAGGCRWLQVAAFSIGVSSRRGGRVIRQGRERRLGARCVEPGSSSFSGYQIGDEKTRTVGLVCGQRPSMHLARRQLAFNIRRT